MKSKLQFIGLGVIIVIISAVVMITGAGSLLPSAMNGVIRIIIMVFAAIAITILVNLAASRVYKKISDLLTPQEETEEAPEDIIKEDLLLTRRVGISDYLARNKSTPFFRETLGQMPAQFDNFQKRYASIHSVLENRFGAGGLSFSKFSSSVDDLQSYLEQLAGNLLAKMEAFDEADYEEKINRFLQQNRLEEAEAHKVVENEYKNYALGVSKQLDSAILKMDILILEMARLSDAELEKAMSALCNMDEAINDTRLYGM